MSDLKHETNRKELKAQYGDREIVGGVFIIKNTFTGQSLLDASTDIRSSRNRFEFAQKTGSCVYLKLQKDWEEQGGDSFGFEVLELLEKSENQTQAEFKTDIALLKDMWSEKLDSADLY